MYTPYMATFAHPFRKRDATLWAFPASWMEPNCSTSCSRTFSNKLQSATTPNAPRVHASTGVCGAINGQTEQLTARSAPGKNKDRGSVIRMNEIMGSLLIFCVSFICAVSVGAGSHVSSAVRLRQVPRFFRVRRFRSVGAAHVSGKKTMQVRISSVRVASHQIQ